MAFSAYAQTGPTSLLTHQELTHPGTVTGSPVNVATKLFAEVTIRHANVEVTANAEGVVYRIETNQNASGDEGWVTKQEFITTTTAADTEALSGTEAIGSKSLGVASTTGFNVGDLIYVEDSSVAGDGEWHRIEDVVAATNVDIYDGLTVAKDSLDFIWDQAEIFSDIIHTAGVKRIRVTVEHRTVTGSDIHFMSEMVTADSIGS